MPQDRGRPAGEFLATEFDHRLVRENGPGHRQSDDERIGQGDALSVVIRGSGEQGRRHVVARVWFRVSAATWLVLAARSSAGNE
ncbi:MAG: hypothetical protein JWR46_284 [Mycobacterium sp.]|nr:hypothetical protein [Mycobacterium sp.]